MPSLGLLRGDRMSSGGKQARTAIQNHLLARDNVIRVYMGACALRRVNTHSHTDRLRMPPQGTGRARPGAACELERCICGRAHAGGHAFYVADSEPHQACARRRAPVGVHGGHGGAVCKVSSAKSKQATSYVIECLRFTVEVSYALVRMGACTCRRPWWCRASSGPS